MLPVRIVSTHRLIECNSNPYLGKQNGWHGELVDRMLEDLAVLVVDKNFPPPPGADLSVLESERESGWVLAMTGAAMRKRWKLRK